MKYTFDVRDVQTGKLLWQDADREVISKELGISQTYLAKAARENTF